MFVIHFKGNNHEGYLRTLHVPSNKEEIWKFSHDTPAEIVAEVKRSQNPGIEYTVLSEKEMI